MTTAKQRKREDARRRAKAAAAAAARQERLRRRWRYGAIAAVIAVIAVGVALVTSRDSGDNDVSTTDTTATTGPTTETTAAAVSVKGKPCVAMAADPPPGAPAVPVKEGPAPTALITEDLKSGTGAVVNPGETVTVNYIGVSCSSGEIFDTSYGAQPATFSLDGVIKGWTDGIPGMKIGGQRLLGIPSDLAYGPQGRPGIPPDESLWFVVEVLDAKPT